MDRRTFHQIFATGALALPFGQGAGDTGRPALTELAPPPVGTRDETMTETVTETGHRVFEELMGAERAAAMRDTIAGGFGSSQAALAIDFAFGSVWARDGLERKQRSLVVLGILIAQRARAELKNHVRIGLTNGLTPAELEEVLIQAIPYAGFPAVAQATGAVAEVLREQGLADLKTAEERGLF